MEIAATMAKVNVLGGSGGSRVSSHPSVKSNGMDSYFERGQMKDKILSANAKSFVPDINIPVHVKPSPHLGAKPQEENINPTNPNPNYIIRMPRVQVA